MEDLLYQQEEVLRQLKAALTNFKKTAKVRLNKTYVDVRLNLLEGLWQTFLNNHMKLIKSADYVSKEIYTQGEDAYTLGKCEMLECLEKFVPTVSPTVSASVSGQVQKSQPEIKLPRINIPSFTGKYAEWISFHDLFTSLIHNNQSLSKVQKLHYLKSSLSGEAEALLRHIPITEANYDEAWSTLKKRFSNKRFVVNALLKRMMTQKQVTTESSNSVKSILDTTNECLSALKNLGIASADWDPMLIYITVNKLDAESVRLWEQQIGSNEDSNDELPTYKQLCVFLESRFRTLEVLESSKPQSRSSTKQSSFHTSASTNSNCNFCKGNHLIYHCKDFIALNCEERKNVIERNGLCYNCLIPNHTVLTCKHKTSCRRCGKRHHSLIHPENKATDQVSERAETIQSRNDSTKVAFTPVTTNVASHYTDKELPSNVLLATAMLKVIAKNGATHHLRALIDQGSQGSFITESATQLLGLNKIPINCTINGLGENGRSLHSKSMVSFQAHSIVDTNFATPVKACVLKSLTRMLPTTEVHNKDWSHLRQLKLADPYYAKPGKVDLLLGADVYGDIITTGLKKGPRGSPIAQNTHLGWILTGQISSTEALHGYTTTLSMHICIEDKMLQRFWEIEEGACKKHLTGEEESCEQHFKDTHKRQEDGRYAVALPFKDPNPLCQYGESRDVAKARWLQMERKLEKDPWLKKEYNEVMNEYLNLQHMQEVKEVEEKNKPTAVYLPHHAVIRADKTTTKVRVVFDASCKYKNQVSLNDDLMVGPRLQQDLRHIIMRWRQHKVGLVADIVKMYRQVVVTQPDFQRILWRENSNEEIRDFRMNRVTFGTASAPYLATKVLQQLALDEKEQHPIAANIALTDFYMDDLLSGADNYEKGISIYNDMTTLLRSGGFELQKWNTNDANLLKIMQGVDNHDKELNLDTTVKTLGIAWNNMRDEFQYSIHLPEQSVVTKRTIASDVSKLFDPMGWLAPTIIIGKVFLQKLWLSGVTWDQEIPQALREDWLKYRSELPRLSEIKIERWLHTTTNDTTLELHGFSDASIMAYAAVVYSRVISPAGDVHVQIISGRTKVAPIKTVSVPRLELCGAVLLAKLLIEVAEHLKVPRENIYAYTDSQVVLAWLQGHPSKWKTFIANRTAEILTTLPAHHWSHVASKENPSDLASRGVSGSMLKNETLWWKGPQWLLEGENKHKVPTNLPEDLHLEERLVHFTKTETIKSERDFTQELFGRYSTLDKLLRVIAWCKRFGKKAKYPTYLTAEELSQSLTVCILLCQREELADDVQCLRANKPIKKRSKLRLLNPFLDEKGVLRVGGRLRHANIPEDAKHQIILPQNHTLSKLIVAQAHTKTLHGGPTLMLNYIRQKFWILGCKNLVNNEVHRCVVCVRYRATTRTQLMADLPQQRVTPTRPFLHSGVDFAGPIDLRMSKGRGCKTYKGYICIFVCMASKAIHIEIVSSLDSESFVAAFKRFTARRGHCSHIWSDNATNFTAGNKQLKDLFENHLETVKNQIYDQLARDGTTWHYIPAGAPNFGGLWEAGVRSIKHHLRRILGNSTLTYEEMSTVTSQIEACLNSRPISPISNDVNDLLPLTPGHFLIGEPPIVVPEPSLLDTNINRLHRWQLTQRLFQHFWNRWLTEYLGRLQQRPKWVKQMDNDIRIGTLVLIKDDNLPPGKWPLARITDVHPGDDGLIRVVSLKCKNTVVKRPITKICLLPVDI